MKRIIKSLIMFFSRWFLSVVVLFVMFAIIANVTVMTLKYFNPLEWDNPARCITVLIGGFIAFLSVTRGINEW
ncbi:hypothetical protein [Vibrio parahaemolyticus]|uniref:hypothetical protein n=1 Tax=Vibrio parahaemolyticus TaxID=670 RepID=UPI0011EF8A84|nr:hypothetical protein [Vibrio parahaemolyticus]KAB5599270.1 hypothetical protein F0578_11635 [Vibrio parahaemolyticus]MEA5281412.1 hypothetical protein [Vibrio parahaemolyticus]